MVGLKVAILGLKIAKKWGFYPSNLLGGTYEHPIGDTYRVVWQKFRENRPRDIENLVDGKKNLKKKHDQNITVFRYRRRL